MLHNLCQVANEPYDEDEAERIQLAESETASDYTSDERKIHGLQ